MVLAAALISGAVYAGTIFDAMDSVKFEDDIKKVKAQVEVIGADVNAASKDWQIKGYTPLIYAIDNLEGQKRRDVVLFLLSQKANPNGKALLDNPTTNDGKKGGGEETPLIAALFSQDFVLVKALLDAGANPTVAIRHSGWIYGVQDNLGHFSHWGNHSSTSSVQLAFGTKYDTSPKLKATALDVAVFLKDPVLVELIKAKAPKLTASYNLDTLWYLAYSNDLTGFKKQIKAGKVPSPNEVAQLLHYGKTEFLAFVDAAGIFPTKQKEQYVDEPFAFSLVDDGPDIAAVSDYLDRNLALATSDISEFTKGFLALPVGWKKVRMWRNMNLFENKDGEDWSFEKIVTGFNHQEELTKAFKMAFYSLDLDGYYESSGSQYLWFKISDNGTQFEARYTKKPEDNKTGKVSIVDVDPESGWLLCDFAGFGKFWVRHGYKSSIDLESSLDRNDRYKVRIGFGRETQAEWDAKMAQPERGK